MCEFLYDQWKNDNAIQRNFAGPPIMNGIRVALTKMESGKATGSVSIAVELLEVLKDYGIELIRSYCSTKSVTLVRFQQTSPNLIFVALPKQPWARRCELHRTISLLSYITKIHLRISMMRIKDKIKPEIAEEQYGFVEGKIYNSYLHRNIIERALEVQKDIHIPMFR